MRKLMFLPIDISPENESDERSRRVFASFLLCLFPEMGFRIINDVVNIAV